MKNYAHAVGELGLTASLRAFARRAAELLFYLCCSLFTFWRECSAVARAAGGEALETINIGLVCSSVLEEKTMVATERESGLRGFLAEILAATVCTQ